MPTVSVLVTTFNRPEKLKRCLESILGQTYTDIEVIIIDDASTMPVDLPLSDRIRYYRNQENQGAVHGDRIHIKRFVNEIARGKYFVYLCDDDFWLFPALLARQVALLESCPQAAMVIGGQISDFGTHTYFHDTIYPQSYMTSDEFLTHFSKHPIECNIIIGATLYNKELFQLSGALKSDDGCRWQAGYEMLMAPGCYGDVIYLDEPCIKTEILPTNASFQRTQYEHYLDSVKSLRDAFTQPTKDWRGTDRESFLMDIHSKTLHNISQAYLANAEHIKQYGSLNMCSQANIARPVTVEDLVRL